ncbi:MAG: SDR family oxidoreductase [Hyphomonadaceae bacterium]|nr:SDR family oxidoreductase [Hyphomonadaceae bacterium]
MFPDGATLVFGATGGIGRVVAAEFAKAGSNIAIMWRSKKDVAEELKREIEKSGRKASLHQCDVTKDGDIERAIDEAIDHHGRVHTMVWGAGPLVEQVLMADTTREQWRTAIDVEVHGFFEASQTMIRHMRDAGGSIVHLGSAGDLSWPEKDVLSVAPKAANESLIKAIAREEGKNNIRANSVLVGVIEAGMFLELSKQGVFDEAWTTEVHKNLALKRWGQPEEVAAAAIFLASDKAGYVTGQQIAVAGGYGL